MMMASTMSDNRNNQSESIHSGQFMVSHFEKDDEEEADENDIKEVLSPKQPPDVTTDPVVGSTCVVHNPPYTGMELQRYNPAAVAHHKHFPSSVEIDTDLSTIFQTLNVTYQQKLTSPKWNPFKGIRLRLKEKIRLNNVIWRCWHMQFILKRKTLVCQFASPLDTDVHNNLQPIVLEGKYWKRQTEIILNEYQRWRRYTVVKALPAKDDIFSELDLLDFSSNSYDMMPKINDDILFSSISQFPIQFPFPDSREMARAGRADFIQPSLGPLQPNFDDFMDIDEDFFNSCELKRLAPVPEEETTEILKAIDNTPSFPMMTSSSKMELLDDTGMTQMNIDSMQQQLQQQIQQQQPSTSQFCDQTLSQAQLGSSGASNNNAFITTNTNNSAQNVMSMTQQQQQTNDTTGTFLLRQKIARGSFYKSHNRREPINYEKTQPTEHQTNVYNQLIQQQQQTQSTTVISYPGGNESNVFLAQQQQQQQPIHASPIQTTTNNFNIISAQQLAGGGVVNDLNIMNSVIQAPPPIRLIQQQVPILQQAVQVQYKPQVYSMQQQQQQQQQGTSKWEEFLIKLSM